MPVGPVVEGRIEHRHCQCAEVGIGLRDRDARNGFDLRCRHLTSADQLTQTDGVEPGVLVQFQQSHSSGRDDRFSVTRRAVRRDRISAAVTR